MIELFENELKTFERHSSKGNQLKWQRGDDWYKADYAGYEGLAEYLVSHLLLKSSLNPDQFVLYELDKVRYKHSVFGAAKSDDFLSADWQIITLERLYKNQCNRSLYENVWKISDVNDRFLFLSYEVKKITQIKDFDRYLATLLTMDALFLNEDRHFHNIAVLMNGEGRYKLCPIFDNGASLLSDTTLDYPLVTDIFELIPEAKAKTISSDFGEQIEAAEAIVGKSLTFSFSKKDVNNLLDKAADYYDAAVIERVRTIIFEQMRKYSYLFK